MADIVRKFYLLDKNNNTFELRGNFGDTPFYHKPIGLGWNIKTEQLTNESISIITDIDNDFKDIAGEFIALSYEEEKKLDLFIQKAQIKNDILKDPDNYLRLYYQVTEEIEEYIQIFIYTYERGEKDEDGKVTIKFKAKKLSNKKKDFIINITNKIGGLKEGTFPLPTKGANTKLIQFSKEYQQTLKKTITNNGTLRVPVKIVFNGKIKKPYWINKTNLMEGEYDITQDNSTLEIDARFPESIIVDGLDKTNIQSRDKDNFLFLEVGKNELEIKPFGTGGAINDVCNLSIIYTEERR